MAGQPPTKSSAAESPAGDRAHTVVGTSMSPPVSSCRARSLSRLRAMQLLTKKNIDVPTTVCARTPDSIDAALQLVGGPPLIIKLQQGAQGIGTMIAETPQAVTSLLETLWAMGQDIILQEYIRESKGRDTRAIVVGGRVVAAMRRQAKAGEFRSNLHRGGLGVRVELDKSYAQAAISATHIMGLEVAGVDMLESRKGPKILEINSSPGLEGIERASGVDVAGAIVAHAERFLARRKRRKRVDMLEGRDGPKILEINSSPGLEGIERTSGLDVAGSIIAHAEKFLARRKRRRSRDAVVDAEQRHVRVRHVRAGG